MRKQIVKDDSHKSQSADDEHWLDLEQRAQIELTSEDATHPIESALITRTGSGWRAGEPGKQTIRLLFDKPLKIRRIQLMFQEDSQSRTQEFSLHWSVSGGSPLREIVRQQYNFSPPDSTRELEDYIVDLDELTLLQISIVPDIGGGDTHATLTQLRLA
jgi:hypothetical protein